MRSIFLAVLFAVLVTPFAEGQMGYHDPSYIPKIDVAIGYASVRSNAPPGRCECFATSGGYVSVGMPVRAWLSAAAEVAHSRDQNIGPLGQNLSLTTYTVGPRLVYRASRFRVFAQAMGGVAHADDSYFPMDNTYSTRATGITYSLGGGFDYHLSRTIDIRPWQLQYLHTGFPNATDNSQKHLMFGGGIVLKFKGRMWLP